MTTTNLEVTDTGMDIYAVTPVHYDPHKTGDKIPAGVLIVDRHITDQDFAVIKNREGVEITVFKEGKPVTSTLDLKSQKDLMAELTQAIGQKKIFLYAVG